MAHEKEKRQADQLRRGGIKTIHLFAGAGGGILADLLLGHRPVCAVEIDRHCRRVLKARQRDGVLPWFPVCRDARECDARPWRGSVDCVSGGFPCQGVSSAGKGLGVRADPRSGLWTELARVIGEVRPRLVFVENTPLLVSRGLDVVLAGLAELGYVARWCVLGAWHAGAPHKRDRIWILAHAEGVGGGGDSHSEFRSPYGCGGTVGGNGRRDKDQRKGERKEKNEDGIGFRHEAAGVCQAVPDGVRSWILQPEAGKDAGQERVSKRRGAEGHDRMEEHKEDQKGDRNGREKKEGHKKRAAADAGRARRDSGRAEQPLQGARAFGEARRSTDGGLPAEPGMDGGPDGLARRLDGLGPAFGGRIPKVARRVLAARLIELCGGRDEALAILGAVRESSAPMGGIAEAVESGRSEAPIRGWAPWSDRKSVV